MKKIEQNDPFKNLVLDEYEQELESAFERGEYQSVPKEESDEMQILFQDTIKKHKELQKAKKITLRVNQGDLIKLKAKAIRVNIPYQTLLSALIRDFVQGKYSIKI